MTRKITRAVARIKAGLEDHVYLGNLDSVRDWGYAAEYVEGMWRMLQVDEPDDFVLATGGNFTVKDFLSTAFSHAGLNWEDHVRFDERFLRPSEVGRPGRRRVEGQGEARLGGHGRHGGTRAHHGRRRHRGARP